MAEEEHDRVGYFRQRWAQENLQYQKSPPPRSNDEELGQDVELSEVDAERPARSDSRLEKAQKRSWRDDPRFSPGRLAPMTASPPASNANTLLQSPVDSQNNTVDTDREFPVRIGEPSKPRSTDKQIELTKSPKWLNELYTLSWLTFFSMLGTLARLGVEAITQYPDAPVTSRVLWANLGGSFMMGFLVEDRNLFGLPSNLRPSTLDDQSVHEPKHHAAHLKLKKTIPLYIGLTTGFCGSFTSFSSFIRDAFLALTNALPSSSPTTPYQSPTARPVPRNGGFSFLAILAILILHPAISLAALKTGAHFALLLRPILPRYILFSRLFIKFTNPLMIFIGFASWLIGGLFLTIFTPSSGPSPVNWRARATIPVLFAPPGCLLRYYLAKYLNRPSTPNFPWGTFVANIFGTLVLGMAWDLQHARSIGASSGNACAVLLGVQEGFCGCLTTVSTWVVELNGLGKRWAWIYGLSSVFVGLAGMVVVIGSMGWTVGFADPVCG